MMLPDSVMFQVCVIECGNCIVVLLVFLLTSAVFLVLFSLSLLL